MSLTLRRIVWSDGTSGPDDYNVIHEGRTVGRMYRMNSTGRQLWRWTQISLGRLARPERGGMVDSLDEPKEAFRAAWEAGGSAPGESGQEMLGPGDSVDDPVRT
jgi:hypothetical protein